MPDLPQLRTAIPGPKSRAFARRLRRSESRNVTFLSRHWPVFWQRARGANVWDVDGNRYLDLTAAFGVASVGHTNPRVVAAIRQQSRQLLHAMGDVHPNELKLRLAEELIALTYRRWNREAARVVFATSGAEAVEIALKTAAIATGRPEVIAFTGAYHGLTYGALDATHCRQFRWPFARQLGHFVDHFPFGQIPPAKRRYAAVLAEPIQGRAGIVEPPPGFLPALRRFCDRHGLLLILDEIYTGFGRTGRWFACEHENVVPDLICVGKALAGGMPLAACIGRADLMDKWPVSTGEAIHTSTFLGHPVACAAALASLAEMKRHRLADRAAALGAQARQRLGSSLRGRGLMLGLPVPNPPRLCERLLRRGLLALPESDVLGITPPLTITSRQFACALNIIEECA